MRSVSYTHLDVYKRQVLRGAGNMLADGITWLYNTLGPVGGGLFGLVYAPITLTGMHPVSYTHLDVYKRQVHAEIHL